MAKMTFRADDHTPEDGEWYTFNEWREQGYGVLKGEKARRFVHGVAVFHDSQVMPLPKDYGEGDFDPYDEMWGLAFGLDGF